MDKSMQKLQQPSEFADEVVARMTRTNKQNNAFHKYIRLLVDAMIQQDLDMRTAVKIPIQPTMENVKATVVHAVMNALYPDIESTADLSKTQITQLYETINQFTWHKYGISIEFPNDKDWGE